ncbi:ABC transporter permease [Lichenihabitans psoromatis]|uniref:ABC transporter permease n=1 Tax=Lichenihabitans psoromatis TaxID=2528642 RepID=UPI00103642C6|nr:ABC transporter permease [Lichenihabitans psoromatis]
MTGVAPLQGAPLAHFVSKAPFDPLSVTRLSPAQERIYLASQWRLMWWKFKRHRMAVVSGIFLLVLYATVPFSEFFAPYAGGTRDTDFIRSPPQRIHFFDKGSFVGPFVYGSTFHLDMKNLRRQYPLDTSKVDKIRFFCHGDPYLFWGLIPGDTHLFCPAEGGNVFLFGTDRLGRDVLSRILYGARVSLTVGLIGISISFCLGLIIGGLAGYYGGWFDLISQRLIEIVHSIPHIPIWLALAAIMPVTWSPLLVYFGITVILGMMDWTGLARAVRAKLLALREEDYVMAAQLMGARTPRVIARHLLPGFISHLIASATITIPSMILGETALSFLGLGLRPPIISWGVMLNEAQNMNVVVLYPWLMLPVVPVILVILAFNFLGDGLRDAADPYNA